MKRPEPNERSRPARTEAASKLSGEDVTILADSLVRRVLQDSVNEALSSTWERRARMWEWARPRPDEWLGERSASEARAKWHELTAIADACRARAALSRQHEGIDPDIDEALGVVA